MKRWFDDFKSLWCVHGNRGGDSVFGIRTRSDQMRTVICGLELRSIEDTAVIEMTVPANLRSRGRI